MTSLPLSAPAPLTRAHRLDNFRCSHAAHESWLRQRALKNQEDGGSRAFVVCSGPDVIGYYALAAGSLSHEQATGAIRRNMPEPIPAVVLGRLAVHTEWAGRGIGASLLKDAVLRTARLADELGVRALLCHAIDENAKRFYLHQGFIESPVAPQLMMFNIAKIPAA